MNALKPEQLESLVSHRIRELRILRGMTQSELAEKIGSKKPHISDIELGKTSPGLGVIAKLSQALDVDPDDILSKTLELVGQRR